jgi:hypothetical protein
LTNKENPGQGVPYKQVFAPRIPERRNQKMKKIAQFGSILAIALVLTACANFRVNMTSGFGPNTPPKPSPGSAMGWLDVANWQTFLVTKKFLPLGTFKPDLFDAATMKATEKFQTTPGLVAKYSLPRTGCVNFATYHKAVQEGMLPYHPVRVESSCSAAKRSAAAKRSEGITTFAHDPFRDNQNGLPTKKGLGYRCIESASWHDVSDWQNFLIANGYLLSGACTLGDFNTSTKSATVQFQLQWCKSTSNGYVNHETWYAATNFASLTNGLGIPLLGTDNGSTTEDPGSCP